MKWKLISACHGKVKLTLPYFTPCNGEDADNANRFYEALQSEIISYAESSHYVRRYSAECDVTESGDRIKVTVLLSARIFKGGSFSVCHRSISDVWHGDRLVSHVIS